MVDLIAQAQKALGLFGDNPNELTTEEKVDASLKADYPQGFAQPLDEPMSQSQIEMREGLMRPTQFANSRYHKLLMKEISMAILNNEDDEDYFTLAMQCILLAESMGLAESRDKQLAELEFDLMLTRARKGKHLEYIHSEGHRIEKTVGEIPKDSARWR